VDPTGKDALDDTLGFFSYEGLFAYDEAFAEYAIDLALSQAGVGPFVINGILTSVTVLGTGEDEDPSDPTLPSTPAEPGTGSGGGGGTSTQPGGNSEQTQHNPSAVTGFFNCTSHYASNWSPAAPLHKIPGFGSGVGGFIVNAVGGNTFSGITDLVMSIIYGQAGGNNVFYNISQGIATGPTLGLGALLPNSIQEIPGITGPIDSIVGTAIGASTWTTIGAVKLIYDFSTYAVAAGGCGIGMLPPPMEKEKD
jgi:hypothetical protein